MDVTHTRKWPLLLGLGLIVVIALFGSWWLYLISQLGHILEELYPEKALSILRLVKWEGLSFFVFILATSIFFLIFYWRDQKKTHAMTSFFASLGHELKTPLTSIQLQTELMQAKLSEDPSLLRPLRRLQEDTQKLDWQLDKILQLSFVERGGHFNREEVDLKRFIEKFFEENRGEHTYHLAYSENDDYTVVADPFMLTLIFRNLLQNTKLHNSASQHVDLTLQKQQQVQLIYNDNGNAFQGNLSQLTTIFYKENSPQGSGIGLYLIKILMLRLKGELRLTTNPALTFHLHFPEKI